MNFLTKSWLDYKRRNGGPNSLEEFVHFVVKYPLQFRKITRLRAALYLKVVIKHHFLH